MPREEEKAHGHGGQTRQGCDHLELRAARVQLLKVHQEDREAVGREYVVVERRRTRRVHVRRHDEAGTRERRTGRRERKDRYGE